MTSSTSSTSSQPATSELAAEETPFDAQAKAHTSQRREAPAREADGSGLDAGLADATPAVGSSAVESPAVGSPAEREAARQASLDELEERRRLARQAAVRRVNRGRGTKILLFVALLFGCALAAIQYQREKLRQWRWAAIEMPEDRIARVPAKWDPPTLAKRLASTGKIRDSGTFLEAARAIGLKTVVPGGYELPAKAGPDDLVRVFMAGPTMEKVTFPEGFTCRKIAQRLQARGFKNAGALLKLAYPSANPNAPSPLEGRWFPDTYLLPRNASAKVLSDRLTSRFDEIISQLPSSHPKVRGKALTRAEVITLASIVERETSVESERAIVAGVLLNRLNKKMRLECDATIQYARERARATGQLDQGHKQRLSYRDIDAVKNSPFNTYERKGLPPAPICNPGRAALEAAIRPKSSKYLFYVMSPAQGRHRFSEKYSDFLDHKSLYKQELRSQKGRS